jgi:hypothetical protein
MTKNHRKAVQSEIKVVYLQRKVMSQKDMSELALNKISFMAIVVALFAKKHRYTEPVVYQYLSRYGGTKLLMEHYGYLHTQDFNQVVDDLSEYCRRQGGTL